MTRRNLLMTLAAGMILDPERLLWVPGAKLISVPKVLWTPDCLVCKKHQSYRLKHGGVWYKGYNAGMVHLLLPGEAIHHRLFSNISLA